MEENSVEKKMISVWEWVGLILAIYGLIIFGVGVKNVLTSLPATVLGHLNAPLWWGAIMFASGGLFAFLGRRSRAKG